jgi:hypothetical protein
VTGNLPVLCSGAYGSYSQHVAESLDHVYIKSIKRSCVDFQRETKLQMYELRIQGSYMGKGNKDLYAFYAFYALYAWEIGFPQIGALTAIWKVHRSN